MVKLTGICDDREREASHLTTLREFVPWLAMEEQVNMVGGFMCDTVLPPSRFARS